MYIRKATGKYSISPKVHPSKGREESGYLSPLLRPEANQGTPWPGGKVRSNVTSISGNPLRSLNISGQRIAVLFQKLSYKIRVGKFIQIDLSPSVSLSFGYCNSDKFAFQIDW